MDLTDMINFDSNLTTEDLVNHLPDELEVSYCRPKLKHLLAFEPVQEIFSTLDKQHICVNTQLKSSKKQLK